jgi:hypothetical protein
MGEMRDEQAENINSKEMERGYFKGADTTPADTNIAKTQGRVCIKHSTLTLLYPSSNSWQFAVDH